MTALQVVFQLPEISHLKAALILSSIMLFFLDILIRGGFRLRLEDAGADLCMAALALNASIVIDTINMIEGTPALGLGELTGSLFRSFSAFLVTFVLWIVCLRLISSWNEVNLTILNRILRFNLYHVLANFIGVLALILVVWLLLEV